MECDGYYGQKMAEGFGIEAAPALLSRTIKHTNLAVTEVAAKDPAPRMNDPIPVEDAYIVGVQMRAYPRHLYWENDRQQPVFDLQAGDVTIYDLKRGPSVYLDKSYHSVHFYVPRAAFNSVADDAGMQRISELDYMPGQGVQDMALQGLARAMMAVMEQHGTASQLFVDHVLKAAVTHIAYAYGHMRPVREPVRGGLAAWQERRVKDIIDARIDGNVTLQEMADECRLSVSHFSRAFRKSTGTAPHRWLLMRRLEIAKSMITEGNSSLPEIALACGFSDQSHFTRVFTRETGISPGAWRRCVCS